MRTILILIALAGCLDAPEMTSTAEQGMYCDPWCEPDHPANYMQQAQDAMRGWMSANCQSCWSPPCGTASYPDGHLSAICDAVDDDGWLVGQCWVNYRASGPTGSGCAAIPPE